MTPLDRVLAVWMNGLVGHSEALFDMALFLCGRLPLVACVMVILALWWTDPEGEGEGEGAAPVLGWGAVPDRVGLLTSRRRCVALAAGVAAAFIITRLLAFGFEAKRPLLQETLAIPIAAEVWQETVRAMTGFGAFPSDHAALFFGMAVGLFAWSRVQGLAALTVVTTICAARVAVGFHYPSDMLAGGAVGSVTVAVAMLWAKSDPAPLGALVGLFERRPALMYPLMFVAALDFTHHFRLVLRTVFYLVLTLLGSG